jgi:hypothetical protein
MASAGSLIFELAADVAHLRADMQKANDTITSSLKGISTAVKGIAALQGVQYATEFARAFADGIKQAIDQADALGKLSERIGTTTEQLSALVYAGRFADVSTEDLTTAFKGLNKALLDARDPASDSAVAIRALGLDVKTLQSEDPAKAFEDIAEAMSGFKDGAEKAAVAQQLFGKQGQALIPLLNGGKEGLEAARKEAESLGLIVSGQTAKAMADLNDNLTRLRTVSEGAFAQIAQQLTPALDFLVRTISDANTEGDTFKGLLAGIGTLISDLIIDVTGLASEIAIAWRELTGYSLAAKQFFAGDFKLAIQTASAAFEQSQKEAAELEAKLKGVRDLQREMRDHPFDMGNPAAGWDDKPVVQFTAGLDGVRNGAKHAKTAVDEFKKMLDSLNEGLRAAQANGDEMQMLLTDPKFLTFTKQQQAQLNAIKQATLDTAAANEALKKTLDDQAKAAEDAQTELDGTIKSLHDFASAQLDSIDPTREYVRTIVQLIAAQNEGMITADEFAKLQQKAADKMIAANDKADASLDDLKRAIEGFGQKASDALVDFMFATDKTAQSFGEMVSSILGDISKMLVYKGVFEPMFASIGNASWLGNLSGFFGGGRAAGGSVSPGQYYRINEMPSLRGGEYFVPNMPGRVVSDAAAGVGSVNVNVHLHKDRETEDTSGDQEKAIELGKRISAVVRQVIATEKRMGGLLAS